MTSEDLNLIASAARARVEQHRLERARDAAVARVRADQNLTAAWKPLSSKFLSAKAKLQPRDSKGRWIDMGATVRWLNGSQIGGDKTKTSGAAGKKSYSQGTVVGFDPKTKRYRIERDMRPDGSGSTAPVMLEGKNLEVIKAVIPDAPEAAPKERVDLNSFDEPDGTLGRDSARPPANPERPRVPRPHPLRKLKLGAPVTVKSGAYRGMTGEIDSRDFDGQNYTIKFDSGQTYGGQIHQIQVENLADPDQLQIFDTKPGKREEDEFEGDDEAFEPDDDQPDFDPEEMTDDRRAALDDDDDDDESDFEPDASAMPAGTVPRHSVIDIEGKRITVDSVRKNGDGTVEISGFDRTDPYSWDRFTMHRFERSADDPIDVIEKGDNDRVPEGYTHAKDLQPGDVYVKYWPDSDEVRANLRIKSIAPGEETQWGRTWEAEVENVETGKAERDYFGDGMGAAVEKVGAPDDTPASVAPEPEAPTPTKDEKRTPAAGLEDVTRGDTLRFSQNPIPGEDIDVKYDTGLVHKVKDGRAWVTFGDVGGWVDLDEGVTKDGHFDFGDDGGPDRRKALAERAGLSDEEMADAPELLPATEELRDLAEEIDFLSPRDMANFHDYLDEVQIAPDARGSGQWDSIEDFIRGHEDSLNEDQRDQLNEAVSRARQESLDGPGTDTIDSMEKAVDAPDNGPGQLTVPAEWAKEKQFDDALGRLKPLTEAEKARTEGDLENNRRAKEAWDADPANFPELPGPLALGDRVSVDGRAGTIIGGRPDGERYIMVGDDGEKFGAHPDEVTVTQSMSDAIDELNAPPAGNVTEFAKNMFQNLHPDANWDEADQTAWLDAAKKAMENPDD